MAAPGTSVKRATRVDGRVRRAPTVRAPGAARAQSGATVRAAAAAGRPPARYPLGVCANRLATAPSAGVLFPSLRRRDAAGTLREEARGASLGATEIPRAGRRDVLLGRARGRRYPSQPVTAQDHDRTDGREAGLARRARRAAGFAVARQLRDVAARHLPRRRRRPAVPDRRPQRVRQGLARDPLPLPDLPDAGPRRRLQRPGRVRGRRERQRRGAGAGRRRSPPSPSGWSPPASARPRAPAAGATYLNAALHLLELHRRVGQPPRPRGVAVGRGAPRPRLQPAVPVRRRRPRQDPPDARHRQRGRRRSSRASASSTRPARSSPTSSSPRSSRARSTSSGPATAGSTCC